MDGEGTIPRIHGRPQVPRSGVSIETYRNFILIALAPMWSNDDQRSMKMMEGSKNNARRMRIAGGRGRIRQREALKSTKRQPS